MSKEKSPQNALELIKALHEFMLGPEKDAKSLPLEKIKKELQNEGFDIESFSKRADERISQCLSQQELLLAKEKRQNLSEKFAQGRQFASNVKDEVLARLNILKHSQPALAQTYYRKLEEASEEDMIGWLEDLEMIDEME